MPEVEQQTEQKAVQQQEQDIISRVSQKEPQKTADEEGFNVNDIEKIEDPQAKEYALKAYKSFERGYTKKFQEVAKMRTQLEQQMVEQTGWTPEKVRALTQNPEFVKAAQEVAGVQEDPYSTLSDEDKARAQQTNSQIANLQGQLSTMMKKQQDEKLSERYKDYEPQAVDILTADLLSGKVQATREHLWKVLKYDDHVKRAYELGRQDRELDLKEKEASSSIDSTQITHDPDKPQQGENERDEDYIKRLYAYNVKQGQQRTATK